MSSRMNGYISEREYRPSSEQMADLHVYLVPQDIWRDKFNNALNQNIDNTVSLGFIRVHPETKVIALRDEIEAQLGSDLIPKEYVFVKSVGRSLTRVKGRQENSLKAKNFLPPQAYAPELYLLEATPEVKALSEGSTRPHTRTSYDYEYQRQKEELLKDLELARDARKQSERQREELVKHAKQMQSKTQSRRNHARDLWKKRYFEEKKKTGPLEEQCNRLRHELDILHKKLLATLEGPKEKATKLSEIKPSNKVGAAPKPLWVSSDSDNSVVYTPPASPVVPAHGDRGNNSPKRGRDLSPITSRVTSPERARNKNQMASSPDRGPTSFRGQISERSRPPKTDRSPDRVSSRIPKKLNTKSLEDFVKAYEASKKRNKQYPVEMIGSKDKKYFNDDQFDSDYISDNSATSDVSHRSPYRRRQGLNLRKSVQFEQDS